MIRYFFKRILLLVPTLVVALVLTFGLSRLVPGDPVQEANGEESDQLFQLESERLRMYRARSARMGLDKPVFYFSFQPAAYPDTLHRIPFRERREVMLELLRKNGNWPVVQRYYETITTLKNELQRSRGRRVGSEARSSVAQAISSLQFTTDFDVARVLIEKTGKLIKKDSSLVEQATLSFQHLRTAFQNMVAHPQKEKLFLPALIWNGLDCQFHHAFTGYLRGDLGSSYVDGRPVVDKIGHALSWTLGIIALAVPIAYLIAILLGVRMAMHKDSRFDRRVSGLLFGLYAMPALWVALVLLVVFTNPDWGMNFVTITGMMDLDENSSWSTWIGVSLRQLTIPIFCLIYPAIATLTRQMRSTMIEALGQDFVRTARAKGTPEQKVIWQHAFPNAAFPLITSLASLLPEMVAGSVLVESIFNIPGMGLLLVYAMGAHDWPVVFGIMLLGALLSIVVLLLIDLAYAWLDPRVRFNASAP